MINAYINSGDVSGAQRTFGCMLDAGFRPNVVVYTTLPKGPPLDPR